MASSEPPCMTPVGGVCFRVLYLFAGRARQADFGQALNEVVALWNSDATALQVALVIEEIDTFRGGLQHIGGVQVRPVQLTRRYISQP